jgi:hypothetical protein
MLGEAGPRSGPTDQRPIRYRQVSTLSLKVRSCLSAFSLLTEGSHLLEGKQLPFTIRVRSSQPPILSSRGIRHGQHSVHLLNDLSSSCQPTGGQS